MPLRTEHVEAAELAYLVVDLDVDAAAGHVRRDRDRANLAGVLDDLGLPRMFLRVQHLVRDALPLQQLAQILGGLDRDRADQNRLALLMTLLDVAATASNLASIDLKIRSFLSSRATSTLVGIGTTSTP